MTLYSVEQLAALLGKTPAWIAREASAGHIPSRKVGLTRLFTGEDVAEYLDRCRKGSDPVVKSSLRRRRKGAT